MNKKERGFANIIIILILVVLAGAGAYIVSVKQVSDSALDETASTTTVVITTEDQKTPTNPKTTPKTVPPPEQKPQTTSTPPIFTDNNQCDVNPDQNGQCPAGCKNYGVPLGCVPQDYDCEKEGNCQICLASGTSIDTPSGPVLVKDLQIGMPVWTTTKTGQRVSGTITKTSKVPVPPTHQMVHLILDDGRELFVSPGHPTIDGKTVGDLVYGDPYDSAHVLSTERVSYGESATYDILPSGDTGFYWANGILIDSTLH